MFAARGLLVSLAFFAVMYCTLSMLVVFVWQGIERITRERVFSFVNLLFGLRIFPFAASAMVTVLFTFPSFWLLERPSLDEDIGTFILALCSLLILGAGLFRVLRDQERTTRTVSRWLTAKTRPASDAIVPTLSASSGAPPLILVGFCKPRVMLSDLATTVLSDDELQVAIRHELGHARSHDNLKKAIVNSIPFPGMGSLESAWQEAAELAADEAAVANREEALNLAAGLIKLSRSAQEWPKAILATGLVSGSSSISLRVERLLAWRGKSRRVQRAWLWALLFLSTAIGVIACYGPTLVLTHRLTELFVP